MSADEQQPAPGVDQPGASGVGADRAAYRVTGSLRHRGSLTLARIVIAALALILIVESGTHIVPAIRAGLHEGTRGYWIVTGRQCVRKACIWIGRFVLPGGHVQVARTQYDGTLPAGIHAGSRIAGLYTGGGQVFPTTGSDLWISLLVALVVALLGLYWATHRWVVDYFRQRANGPRLATPLR